MGKVAGFFMPSCRIGAQFLGCSGDFVGGFVDQNNTGKRSRRDWAFSVLHDERAGNSHSSFIHQEDTENTQKGTGSCQKTHEGGE